MKLKAYVAAVVMAAATAAVLAGLSVQHATPMTVSIVILLTLLVIESETLTLALVYRSTNEDINLIESALVPVMFFCTGWQAAAIVAGGQFIAGLYRRNSPMKLAFNTAQWVLGVCLGVIVMHSLRSGEAATGRNAAALIAAILTAYTVNQLCFAILMRINTGSWRESSVSPDVLAGRALGFVMASGVGALFTAAMMWSPWVLVVAFLMLPVVSYTSRGFAAARADAARLESMQRATHALAAAMDVNAGLRAFLCEVRAGFEVEAVELVLFDERGAAVHACTERASQVEALRIEQHPLADALAAHLAEPARFVAGDGTDAGTLLAATRHRRLLAAPLRSGATTLGMLFLYDRLGMEGFEHGELKVVDTLAREVVGFLERVTLLQAIDDERRKLADILGSTSDGIFSITSEGTITSWNAGLAAMTGYDANEIVGTRHFGLLRARDGQGRDLLIERWAELIDSPSGLPADVQIVTQSGQTVWLSCSYSRIPANDASGDSLVVVARNVTQARELEKLKDDFVAVVSHELRTPLVPIKGWAQTLLNRGDRLNDDQRRTAVQSILAQAQKLESLVLNILEASRIEAGRVDGDGVADVAGITARIVEDTLASRPDRTLRMRPPSVPCNVKGSAVWVERAVANLVANAIKYSPDDEPVDVVITAEGDDVLVAVTDRGPGIAMDSQDRIFERFERLEESRKQTGTGLGLYITRRLARAMGGDVTVSSLPGAGSTFLLRLPVAPVGSVATTRLPEQQRGERRGPDPDDMEEHSNVVRLH